MSGKRVLMVASTIPFRPYMIEIKDTVDGSNYGRKLGPQLIKVFVFSLVLNNGNEEKWSKKRSKVDLVKVSCL